ncbi:MAG: YajQ family cyclic di-GMP-binding protein [Gammaproteobacteria bacterium]|nr:YajQ family cyclic di-GMP-binding protein [Gammaproteobacteria bacterium]
MPSFDIVSEVDSHELANSVDQANREISNRFDFRGTNSRVEHIENSLTLIGPAEFQIGQMTDILQTRLAKRGIDVRCLEFGKIQESASEARQEVAIRRGIDRELAKRIVKIVKDSRLKVQASVQGDQVRVSGKKRDDLQQIIALLRNEKIDVPLQFVNLRD